MAPLSGADSGPATLALEPPTRKMDVDEDYDDDMMDEEVKGKASSTPSASSTAAAVPAGPSVDQQAPGTGSGGDTEMTDSGAAAGAGGAVEEGRKGDA
ncbi:hypothetical protein KEM52_006625 [Ascosphaera acerosa]|nr:hypothetical protein KEM52_006625 [Ascosphaera acerosa]